MEEHVSGSANAVVKGVEEDSRQGGSTSISSSVSVFAPAAAQDAAGSLKHSDTIVHGRQNDDGALSSSLFSNAVAVAEGCIMEGASAVSSEGCLHPLFDEGFSYVSSGGALSTVREQPLPQNAQSRDAGCQRSSYDNSLAPSTQLELSDDDEHKQKDGSISNDNKKGILQNPTPLFFSHSCVSANDNTPTTSSTSTSASRLRKQSTLKLRQWFKAHQEHPYPSEQQKEELSELCGISRRQLNDWFVNVRKRVWTPTRTDRELRETQNRVKNAHHKRREGGQSKEIRLPSWLMSFDSFAPLISPPPLYSNSLLVDELLGNEGPAQRETHSAIGSIESPPKIPEDGSSGCNDEVSFDGSITHQQESHIVKDRRKVLELTSALPVLLGSSS